VNLAQVINPATGHVDPVRVRFIQATELDCGCTLQELLSIRRADVRVHIRALPPGQGRRQEGEERGA